MNINYSKACLNRSTVGLNNLFRLDRCLVYTGPNYIYIHFVDGTVNSIWYRQVFGLLRVRFRQVFDLGRFSVYSGFGLDRFHCICVLVTGCKTAIQKKHVFFSIVCTENMPSSKKQILNFKMLFLE